MKKSSQVTMDILKDQSRSADFTKAVKQTKMKLDLIKEDAKNDKNAKAYADQVENQYRLQLKFLYEAAAEAFPEDGVEPRIAMSSLGPEQILDQYEFLVLVSRKEK